MRAPTQPGAFEEPGNRLLPQHDPTTRELVAMVGHWQVRQFTATDPRVLYGKSHGLWHIQLWQPTQQCSILTPSRLTGGKFEFFSDERRFAAATWAQLRARCSGAGVGVPSGFEIASLKLGLLLPLEDGATVWFRAWWHRSPLKRWL